MATAAQKARISFRCRRGMLELDALLERFLSTGFDQLSQHQVEIFEHLLEEPDPVLLDWLTGLDCPKNEEVYAVVQKITAGSSEGL